MCLYTANIHLSYTDTVYIHLLTSLLSHSVFSLFIVYSFCFIWEKLNCWIMASPGSDNRTHYKGFYEFSEFPNYSLLYIPWYSICAFWFCFHFSIFSFIPCFIESYISICALNLLYYCKSLFYWYTGIYRSGVLPFNILGTMGWNIFKFVSYYHSLIWGL